MDNSEFGAFCFGALLMFIVMFIGSTINGYEVPTVGNTPDHYFVIDDFESIDFQNSIYFCNPGPRTDISTKYHNKLLTREMAVIAPAGYKLGDTLYISDKKIE